MTKIISEADWAGSRPSVASGPGLMNGTRLSRAMATIAAMPARRREVFLLHRIDDLSYLEISRRIRISIRSVEDQVSAAMAQLAREAG